MTRFLTANVTILFVLGGCCSFHASDHPGRIKHLVLCWQKSPGDESVRQKLIATSKELGKLPGVMNVAAGRAVPSTRPVVDASFDVGFVMTFKDEATLHAYENNPTHLKAVSEILRPLTTKTLVYDIRE